MVIKRRLKTMFKSNDKKPVQITMFKRGGDIQGHWEGRLTRKELLEKVGKWWDSNGTGLDDYDGIQVLIPFERDGNE